MIALTLTLLFAVTAVIALVSLADSAVRGRNAWRSIRREMAFEQSGERVTFTAEVVAFHDIKHVQSVARSTQTVNGFTRPLAAAA